jgi:hypothetical protein
MTSVLQMMRFKQESLGPSDPSLFPASIGPLPGGFPLGEDCLWSGSPAADWRSACASGPRTHITYLARVGRGAGQRS